jgi:1-aminocyclopropane-1-carboxylate deaminase/D-cysteine desulfhydrase-like pyridoxal-dependent ACC family enzyme
MQDIQLDTISIDKLFVPLFDEKKVAVDILRLDKIHPLISGNKWFKLRYNLQAAKSENKKAIVTYGGAWSNHILATAAACNINNIRCYGIIRGEEAIKLSPTLLKAKELGMQLQFVSREDFQKGYIPYEFNLPDYYFIPEGGYGIPGAEGAATILDYCPKENYTHICCAAGTGTMTAGLVMGSLKTHQVISISVLKNNYSLEEEIKELISKQQKNFTLIHDYHFGGYAKYKPELIDFMNGLYRLSAIPSDFVYTGKLFFAIIDLISNNFFPPGSSLLLVHSGGLQGNSSLRNGTLIF